jgi:glycosyltransferase involved in cell wall biosynthesis
MKNKSNKEMTKLPFVSVIVPVYNDENRIGKCIESLLCQTYPKDEYEIIIVDNNSNDNTQAIIKKYPVKMLIEDNAQSSYAARNKGIQDARGEILAFTDSDAEYDKNCIENAVIMMKLSGAEYIACNVLIKPKIKNQASNVELFDMNTSFCIKNYMQCTHYAPTVGLFIYRKIIDEVGMFDGRLFSLGDLEFGQRVYTAGFKQDLCTDALVYHPTRSSLKSHMKKRLRTGLGSYSLSHYYPERYGRTAIISLVNPLRFLPPKFSSYLQVFKDYKKYSMKQNILLYFCMYLRKIFENVGRINGFIKYNMKEKNEYS